MGRYDRASERTGWGLPLPGTCSTDDRIPELLVMTRDDDPLVRRLALKHLCPCRLRRASADGVWDRVFELSDDPDAGVRKDAIHTLIAGSPAALADRIVAVLEARYNDPDPKLRRYVRKARAAQRRTGRINVG